MQPRPEEGIFERETIEAHLAADVAEIAYEDARLALVSFRRDDFEGERDAAVAKVERARERLENAKRRYRELAMRDAGRGIVR
jgi:hypothetical protein